MLLPIGEHPKAKASCQQEDFILNRLTPSIPSRTQISLRILSAQTLWMCPNPCQPVNDVHNITFHSKPSFPNLTLVNVKSLRLILSSCARRLIWYGGKS